MLYKKMLYRTGRFQRRRRRDANRQVRTLLKRELRNY